MSAIRTESHKPEPDWSKVPAELRDRPQWVVWRFSQKPDGKRTKVPFQARHPLVQASTIEPTQWANFDEALAAWRKHPGVEGPGYVFAADDPYCGVDFDGCIDRNGEVDAWAESHLEDLGGYQEVSPSGKGIKAIVRAKVGRGHKNSKVEVYSQARFFTITGQVCNDADSIDDRNAVVAALVSECFPEPRKAKSKAKNGRAATLPIHADDASLLALARGATNGAKFRRLYDLGDSSGYPGSDGEPDASAADLALCSMLAFYVGPNTDALDRLFRRSKLMRDKWDEKRGELTYGERTIDKALSRDEFYQGKQDWEPKIEGKAEAAKGSAPSPAELVIRASDVEEKEVQWLWPDRIPLSFLTLLAGRTGIGKSFVALDVAARMTVGGTVPLSELTIPLGNVLIISEDSHEYVLKPRLRELGADMDRVFFMTWEAMGTYKLDNTEMLGLAYKQAGEPKLIIIDPPTNFLGARDEHKNSDVRTILMAVASWTMQRSLSCIFITHCNKGINKSASALDRVIGSVAWATTSRVAHLLAPDPNDSTRCLFVPIKNNLGDMAKGISYQIERTLRLAKVRWLGESDLTSDEALNTEARPRARNASAWIVSVFRTLQEQGEPLEIYSNHLKAMGREEGVSPDAIYEAGKILKIRKVKVRQPDGKDLWLWHVPPNWEMLAEKDTA